MAVPANKQTERPQAGWVWRRRIIVGLILWGVGVISYIVGYGEDTRLNETTVQATFAMITLLVGSYIFGANQHDNNMKDVGNGKPT